MNLKKLTLIVLVLPLLSGSYAMMTTYWEEPKDNEPQAKIYAEKEIGLMSVNGLPVNDWKYWTFEEFVLPAGKSKVVIRARNGNEHYGLGVFALNLEAGATYYLKKEEIGDSSKIFFLDENMKELFVSITPKRSFSQPFTLPVYAIPKN